MALPWGDANLDADLRSNVDSAGLGHYYNEGATWLEQRSRIEQLICIATRSLRVILQLSPCHDARGILSRRGC